MKTTSMTVSEIQSLTKQQQYEVMRRLRKHCALSQAEIARKTGMSVSLVNYVYQGVNRNAAVIQCILDHVPEEVKNQTIEQP